MDIDIDLPTTFSAKDFFPTSVQASREQSGQLLKHPAGIYFQKIPIDVMTDLAAIPYEEAEQLGYFKIDFLHLGLLDTFGFTCKQDIRTLIQAEPNWDLLQNQEVVEQLFQLKKHFVLLLKIKPRSVEQLADCIALLRPAKISLIDQYIKHPEHTRNLLYKKPLPAGCFKKGHAIAYALTIVLQLHLIEAGLV